MTTTRVSLIVLVLLYGHAAPGVAQTLDDVFNPASLNDIRLMLHSSDWQNLKTNFLDNTYYPTDLTWGSITVRNVGIRSRGLGSRSPIKPGLRVDFDRYATGQRFLGAKSIILDNLTQDPSMMKEVLSMSLFNRVGLPAPREAFVRLYVNNTLVGLYAVVESIDKNFLDRAFGQDGGNLYEYDYTTDYNFEYLGSAYDPYANLFKAKTNETHSQFDLYDALERMIRTVNQAADGALEGALAPFFDLATFMRHLAVETFLAENDGLLGYAGLNNFYLYQFKNTSQFQVVTWDKDNTFVQADFPLFLRADRNVLVRRALTIPAVRQAYLTGVIAAADSAAEGQAGADGSTGWLGREVERLYALIRPAALEDVSKPFGNADFEAAVAGLRVFARVRGAFMRCEVANQSRTPQPCAAAVAAGAPAITRGSDVESMAR
jgi:hypothetical protein